MTPAEVRAALETACTTNREVAVELIDGTLGFYLVVECREASVVLLARGSVVERPLVAFERVAAVRVLGSPSLAALRGLAIERRRADERRQWAAQRDVLRRAEWAKHDEGSKR